ncbi:MAG: 4-(cytidine 5'-diphospho)-2-C-methyl-D-erythritol kinase [Syntrophomonadaceae bacterium]|nr:4-(cytidine 5'-diphospho)-2-C-methyl-D-erythritol kinase [Syntrophomonadaceae bacterium]
MKQITVSAPAKINLTLDVLGKRADGYHNIESVMHQINLCDQVCVTQIPEGIEVYSNRGELPGGKTNLAYRAAEAMVSKLGIKTGFRIFLEKNIPLGAGLAGGSTNAAAVIKAIDQLLGLNMHLRDMLEIGQRTGSDVPFCLLGDTAIARGRGELLTRVNRRIKLHLLLVNPGFQVSTARIYNLLDQETITDRPDSVRMAAALANGDFAGVVSSLNNVMEKVTLKLHPEVAGIKDNLVQAGAAGALMSGSGPTVFGLFSDAEAAHRAFQVIKGFYPYTFCCSSYRANGG